MDDLLRKHGLSRSEFRVDARIPHGLAVDLLDDALAQSGDPALALHAAEHIRPGDFDALEYALRASSSLRESMQRCMRYVRLMHDGARFDLVLQGPMAVWSVTIGDAPLETRAENEYALGAVIVMGRMVTGLNLRPLEVRLPGPPPEDTTEYHRILADRVEWHQATCAVVFPAVHLELPISPPNPELFRVVTDHADRLLAQVTATGRFTRKIRELVLRELPAGASGATTLDLVATRLEMNPRTLRRRLAEEGTTFFEQLDEVRRELAIELVTRSHRPLTEVAFLLGFSSPSALNKAFRRWTGQSPKHHRRAPS